MHTIKPFSQISFLAGLLAGLIFLFVIFLSSCKQKLSYPPTLEYAIDLFFEENKNDSVLMLLDSDELRNQPTNICNIKETFRAAALAETGRADSAMAIMQRVNADELKGYDLFYYKSVMGLTQFRLTEYQQFLKTTTPLLNNNEGDIRCRALNERIMARTMSYYGNYELAIKQLISSYNLYMQANLEKSAAINKKFLANIYSSVGNWSEAIESINVSQQILESENDIEELHYMYIVASKIYLSMNDTDKARQYINKVLKLGNYSENNQKLASLMVYLGNIEKLDGNYLNAIDYYNTVLEIEEEFFSSNELTVETYIGFANLYNTIGEHDKAIEYGQMALNNIGKEKEYYFKYEIFNELAAANLHSNPFKAYEYLDSVKVNLSRYHRQTTVDLSDYLNIKTALDEESVEVAKLQEANKRSWIISIAAVTLMIFIGVFYTFISKMKVKIKDVMIELISLNLLKAKNDKRTNEIIKKHIDISQKESNQQQLSKEDKNLILFTDFSRWLESSKAYLDPHLDLNTAAKELGTNRSYLSQSINSQGISFTEQINKYRIREVLSILEDENNEKNSLTLQELSSEAGFNSKSTFFNTFRKETGMTPIQFKEHIRFIKFNEN